MKVCKKKLTKKQRDNLQKHSVVDEKGYLLLPTSQKDNKK